MIRYVQKKLLVFVLLINCIACKSQTSNRSQQESIQGILEGNMNSESEELYKIISGNRSLGISFTNNSSISDFYLNESVEGFQNYKYGEVDSVNIKWFDEGGKYFTSIIYEDKIDENGWVSTDYCVIPEYFECDGELMSINGGRLMEFVKINELPQSALKMLFHRGILDNRNYLKEYLNLYVLAIKSLKCTIYSKPDKPTNVRLSRNDVVVIIEEAGKWLKIKYGDSGTGWIKKEDVKKETNSPGAYK